MEPVKRAKRVQRKFIAKFRFYRGKLKQEPSIWNLVTIRNLSSNGILFNYNQKIPLKTILEINMTLPFDKDIHCLGKVVRIEKNPSNKKELKQIPVYGIAVNFIELDTKKIVAINNYANKFSSEK